jgi:hypothetical protein
MNWIRGWEGPRAGLDALERGKKSPVPAKFMCSTQVNSKEKFAA